MNEYEKKWIWKQSQDDRDRMLMVALERLIETEEIRFRVDDIERENGEEIPEDEVLVECFYWRSCGDDIRESADF